MNSQQRPSGDRDNAPVARPSVTRDTEEYQKRAIESMRRADRWLHAAMDDADRVFKRGQKST